MAKRKRKKVNNLSSAFDPNGSYTGICVDDKFQKPLQDADDL